MPFTWPETVEEIIARSQELKIIATNRFDLKSVGLSKFDRLAELVEQMPFDQLLQNLEMVNNGKTVIITRSVEVDWVGNLFVDDKFAVLNERHLMSHKVFYVPKSWKYQEKFLKL